MLKTVTRLIALLAVLAFAPLASAAEEKAAPAAPPPRFGFGIGVNTLDFNTVSLAGNVQPGADIYVPIDLGAFRLEPSLGISRWSADNGAGDGSSVNLGCGFLFPLKASKTVNVYAGGRIFLDFVSLSAPAPAGGTVSDSGVDFTLDGVLGAEWFADPRFSVGAEARHGFTVASTLSSGRNGYNSFGTSGVVFFRFYP
jgi:hypothetical protein